MIACICRRIAAMTFEINPNCPLHGTDEYRAALMESLDSMGETLQTGVETAQLLGRQASYERLSIHMDRRRHRR